MGKRVAVILSGCGFKDGSEIHESVLCLLALARAGHTYHCFAPDMKQKRVVNHLTGQVVPNEERNVLVESARIARGDISPLSKLKPADYDAILLPGGFGAALNLCSYGEEGEECSVLPELKAALLGFHEAGKAIGATCIAPAAVAKSFQGVALIEMTFGTSKKENQSLERMGMKGTSADVRSAVVDRHNKVYTTPCYMEPPDLAGMFEGITKLVAALGE
jgi:enhancing lycopene biosynthesis protein 2